MKNRTRTIGPIVTLLFVIAACMMILLLPGSVRAWDAPCVPLPSLSAYLPDMALAPDGTLWVVNSDSGNSTITVFTITGTCTGTTVPRSSPVAPPPQVNPAPQIPEDALTAFEPTISVNSSGDVVIMFRDQVSPYSVYYQRKRAANSSFDPAVKVAAGSGTTNDYVGSVAIDDSGNVHAVWYTSAGGGFYRKYDSNDTLVITTRTLTNSTDAEPKVAVDASDIAYVVYQVYPTPTHAEFRKVFADGTMSSPVTVADLGDNILYPSIRLGSDGSVNFSFQGRNSSSGAYQPFYRHCNNDASTCGSQIQLDSGGGQRVRLAMCQTIPYVSWHDSNNPKNVHVSSNLGAGVIVSGSVGGSFNSIAAGNGYAYVFFRGNDGKGYLTRNADSNCPSGTPTPTVTGTLPTMTPTDLPVVVVDDPSVLISYAGTWKVQSGNPSCEIGTGWHYAAANNTGNTASLTFDGVQVSYDYIHYTSLAQVDILIDNNYVTTVDPNFGPVGCSKWTSARLTAGTHTIKIRPKSGGSCTDGNCNIPLDAFEYIPSPLIPTATNTLTPTITPTPTDTATRLPTVNAYILPVITFDASP